MTPSALMAPRLWRMLVLPLLGFLALAWATEDRALILVLNIVQVGVATAVVVAFTPEVLRILLGRRDMTRGSWMAYGIWVSWGSIVWRTAESLVWRLLGQPPWIINSDLTSFYLFWGCVGAAAHIVKPGELDERIPPRETIRIGVIVGALVAVGLGVVYAPEIMALLGHRPVQGYVMPRWVG